MKQYWYYCGFRSHFYFMKTIKDYENYSITEDGKVWSHFKNKFIKPHINNRGYLCIRLHNKEKSLKTSIHRLVAIAYVKNIYNKSQVNHINGNKSDNRIENLEWVTHEENQLHAYKIGLKKPSYHEKFYRGITVLDTNTGIFYNSINEAAIAKGYNKGTLKDYLRGKRNNKTSLILA